MNNSFPRWAAEEISKASWRFHDTWEGSGYVLEINEKARQIDVQFYDRLPEGRYIATLDLPSKFDIHSLEMGEAYVFQFKVFQAPLSPQLVSFLAQEYSVKLDSLYRFELATASALDQSA